MIPVLSTTDPAGRANAERDDATSATGDPTSGNGPVHEVAQVAPQLVAALGALATGIVVWPFNCDDAAISFRFADQFADGAPLGTLFRGEAPVSGFSNPLWTLILSTTHRVGLPITGTAKVLGLLAAMATAVLVVRLVARLGGGRAAQWPSAAVGLSATTAIWAVSGLENASVGLLVVATTYLLVTGEVRRDRRAFGGAAITLALLAVSRPDAFVYVAAGALAVLIIRRRTPGPRRVIAPTVWWLAVPVSILAAWTWFSIVRFGHPLPNTYYAKVDTSLADRILDPFGSMQEPLRGVRSFAGDTAAIAIVPLAALGATRRWRGAASTPLLFLAAAFALPLSERDWMLDHRFFTTAVPLLIVFAALGTEDLWQRGRAAGAAPVTRTVGVAAAIGVAIWGATNVGLAIERRSSDFRGQVTTERIGAQARNLEAAAEHHGIHHPIVMTADAGATLFDRELSLVDMAGLVDPQIGQLMDDLGRRREYAFTERRPDVIRAADPSWAWHRVWQLDDESLRRSGYIPTGASVEPTYVRRDLVVRTANVASARPRVDELTAPAAVDGGRVTVRVWIAGLADLGPEGEELTVRLARPSGEATYASRPLGDLLDPGPGWSDDEAVLHVARLEVPSGSGTLHLSISRSGDPSVVLGSVEIGDSAEAVARAADALVADIATPEDAARRLIAAMDLADAAPNRSEVTDAITAIRDEGRALALRRLLEVATTGSDAVDPATAAGSLEAARRELTVLRGRHDPSAAEAAASKQIRRAAPSAPSAQERYRMLVVAWTLDPRSAAVQAELLDARDARPPASPAAPGT